MQRKDRPFARPSSLLAGILIACFVFGAKSAAAQEPVERGQFTLWQLPSQTGAQMMSYVLKTKNGKILVIDGGYTGDAKYLKGFLAQHGQRVDAWFISHPHDDHFGALTEILGNPEGLGIDGSIYASMPSEEWVLANEPAEIEPLRQFNRALKQANQKITEARLGQVIDLDGVRIEVLGVKNPGITQHAINNSSLVIRVSDSEKSVLFLGDLEELGGQVILNGPYRDRLRSDFVQMAHHGQQGVSEAFYQAVKPSYCLWPTPGWLWDNDSGGGKGSGPWKTLEVRAWMDKLDVRKHFVSANGLIQVDHNPSDQPKTAETLVLAENGKSKYQIVIARDASPPTRYGAEELQRFIEQMTGAKLAIKTDDTDRQPYEILIGASAHLTDLKLEIDYKKLGSEGYIIQTGGQHLVIAGGNLRGNLYGVYGLLEEHFGCRWFTPKVSKIPKYDRLVIGPCHEEKIPVFEYRDIFLADCLDGDWAARNRLNSSNARLEEKHGGKVSFGEGFGVHTFDRLVPPEEYFDKHPEYFSEIGGKRVKADSQLCATNPEVARIAAQTILAAMRREPNAFVYSVSQNDRANYCECSVCAALAKEEGTQMAPILLLVNRVAEIVEKEFPDKAIETLSYTYSRKPPKSMRPRKNVIVRLCSIESSFAQPLDSGEVADNLAFKKDLQGWSKLTDRLWIWDYTTSFYSYLVPFPNYYILDDNIRLFAANHVKGVFEQDNYESVNGEMSQLGGYLLAKYLWNPNYDQDQAVSEFLASYYGPAGEPIRQYLDLMSDHVRRNKSDLSIIVEPTSAYLNDELLWKADNLWGQAEAAVSHDPELLERVRLSRLSVDYTILQRAGEPTRDMFIVDQSQLQVKLNPQDSRRFKVNEDRLNRYLDTMARSGITRLVESNPIDAGVYCRLLKSRYKDVDLAMTESVTAAHPQPGIRYEYYQGKGGWQELEQEWTRMPKFDALAPDQSGVSQTFNLDARQSQYHFAFRFKGLIKIPTDGVYTFYLSSDDGSRLFIGDASVVDNDGLHGMGDRFGFIALKAGLHPISVMYFNRSAGLGLKVSYEGPDLGKQEIPASVLFHE